MLAALAHRRHDEDSVAWDGADIDAVPAADAAVPYVMGFQGSTCFMVTRTNNDTLPTNLDTSQGGGGEEASPSAGSVLRVSHTNSTGTVQELVTSGGITAMANQATTSDTVTFRVITQKAQVVRDAMPLAYERAVSAQQRPMVRFQRVRRRTVPPRLHRFRVGDNVYVAQNQFNSLDVTTTRTTLRVEQFGPMEFWNWTAPTVQWCQLVSGAVRNVKRPEIHIKCV